MTVILGNTLRQGRLFAYRHPAAFIGSVSTKSSSTTTTATLLSITLRRCIQQQGRSSSAAQNSLASSLIGNAPWRRKSSQTHNQLPITQVLHHLYHTSASPLVAANKVDSLETERPRTLYHALSPATRSAIIADLRSVDADNNGKIDAQELKVLLGKHNDSFSESEILELSELFYTSLGAGGVDIDQFVEALDAAASKSASEKIMEEKRTPLVVERYFKTHPLGIGTCASEYMYTKTHGGYSAKDLDIELTHVAPVSFSDRTALFAVKCVRFGFDTATLWNVGSVTKEKILNRAIFLETIAAIPGMVAAIIRHFRSLRNMARDGGMLNMFLEEANNERMHLLTFIRMKEPGYLFRTAVVGAQFGFGSFFLTAYIINPNWCHRFIGYIEEEACSTYTKILIEMDQAPASSELAKWKADAAPRIAIGYWHLGEEGTVYDVMKAVRADEAEHRDVNHAVSGIPDDTVNPLYDPRVKLDKMMRKYVNDIMTKTDSKLAGVL